MSFISASRTRNTSRKAPDPNARGRSVTIDRAEQDDDQNDSLLQGQTTQEEKPAPTQAAEDSDSSSGLGLDPPLGISADEINQNESVQNAAPDSIQRAEQQAREDGFSNLREATVAQGVLRTRALFEDDIDEASNESELFNYYNQRANVLSIEQNENLRIIANSLALNKNLDNIDTNSLLLLSHETYKLQSRPESSIVGPREIISNGPFIDPEQLFLLNKSYLEGKITNINKRFLNNQENQNNYLQKIKENVSFKKDYLKKFNSFYEIMENVSKKANFANQALAYANNMENTKYIGKVSNAIFEKEKNVYSSNKEVVAFHTGQKFLQINNFLEEEQTDRNRYDNVKNVLVNYYKMQDSNQTEGNYDSLFTNTGILDSNILISKALINSSLSLKNIHDGSFTNPSYVKEDDHNFSIYDSIENNSFLKRISAFSLISDYDLFDESISGQNFTSPIFTNRLSPNEIKTNANNFSFKEESIYKNESIYLNSQDRIDFRLFRKTSLLKKNDTSILHFESVIPGDFNSERSLPGEIPEYLVYSQNEFYTNFLRNFNENQIQEEISRSNVDNQNSSIMNNRLFSSLFGENILDYFTYRNNILEIDAFVLNFTPEIAQGRLPDNVKTLVYFDAENCISDYDDNDPSRIKFLNAPTLTYFSLFANAGGDDQNNNIISDSGFVNEQGLGGDKRAVGSYNSNLYITECLAFLPDTTIMRSTSEKISIIPFNFLRYNLKDWLSLSKERVSYLYGQNPSGRFDGPEFIDELWFYNDRIWRTNDTNRISDSNLYNNTIISQRNQRSLTSVNPSVVGFGPYGERARSSLGFTGSSLPLILAPTIKSTKYFPYFIVENTNKIYDFNSSEIKEKFLKDSGNSLTSSSEEFYSRVISSSSSREKYNQNNQSTFSKFKESSTFGNDLYDWVRESFKIKRNLYKLKSYKIRNNNYLNFLKEYSNRSQLVASNISINNAYSVVHGDEEVNSKLFSLEESPFLYQKEDTFFEINSFDKNTNNKIKNINSNIDQFSEEEIQNLETFVNENDFKEFMSEYYPDSFLKNSSNLLTYFLEQTSLYIKEYNENFIFSNKKLVAFEKLLSDSLVNKENFKMFLLLVLKEKIYNEDNARKTNLPKTFFDEINKESSGLYENYLNSIFSLENISKQKTYTLRTIDDTALLNLNKNYFRGRVPNGNGKVIGGTGRNPNSPNAKRAKRDFGFIATSGGEVKNYLFPFHQYTSKMTFNALNIGPEPNGLRMVGLKKSIANVFRTNTYNYDVYVHSGNENNINSQSLFSKENIKNNNLNVSLNYIVLTEDLDSEINFSKLDESDLISEGSMLATRSIVRKLSGQDADITDEDLYDRIPGNLYYRLLETVNFEKDYTVDLINNEKTFTNKLSSLIASMINYLFNSDEIEDITPKEFISNNSTQIDSIYNICLTFIEMYKRFFSFVSELSFHKNIPNEIRVDDIDDIDDILWDNSVRQKYIQGFKNLFDSNRSKCILKDYDITSVEAASPRTNTEYVKSKEFIDYFNMLYLFNKSDYLESISNDLIYAYISNFEENKTNLILNNEEKNEISKMINEDSEKILEIENINFSNLFLNELKICKVSKNMQNKAYYNIKKESLINNIFNTSSSPNLNDVDLFRTEVLIENDKKNLAESGLEYFLKGDNTSVEIFNKIDVLRFGIPYSLANSLNNSSVLMITVYPINHKIPEIEFYPYEFLYTPIFTNLTPADANSINSLSNFNLNNSLGLYDINSKDFISKYSVINKGVAEDIAENLLRRIRDKRSALGYNDTLNEGPVNIAKLISGTLYSNSVKYLNESYNSIFDDNKINRLNIDFDNIISEDTFEIVSSFNSEAFYSIFGENHEEVLNYLTEENGYSRILNTGEIIEKNIHSVEYLKNIDKDMSNIDFLSSITTEAFFDIFSVRISKEGLRNKIKTNLTQELQLIVDSDDFSNSYTYAIQLKVF